MTYEKLHVYITILKDICVLSLSQKRAILITYNETVDYELLYIKEHQATI